MPSRNSSTSTSSPLSAPVLRGRIIAVVLVLFAVALGFLIPYVMHLNAQVTERFGQLRWQVPTRVYARPLVLAPGVAMDAATLKVELAAAGYLDDGKGLARSTYRQDGGRFVISSRGYIDVDGRVPAQRIDVQLSGGRVASLREVDGERLRAARLDPARIATLYGSKQEERRLVRIEEVPELLVTGLQAVEDRDFNNHFGIDVSGMARALWVAVRSRGETLQGASTLTQQLARSGLLGIGKERNITRKFNEILYSLIIEARYEKRVILEAYLNQVDLGQRGNQAIHGVASGAEFWFGRQLDGLSTEQMALLIGMVKGPSYYNPRRNPERALERRNFVIGKLLENGLIDQAEYERAVAAPLGVPEVPSSLVAANRFPAYIDLVRRQLGNDYPERDLQGAGLSVFTGMSPSAQAYTEGAVLHTIKTLESKRRPPLQAGAVLTDVHSGDVLAVVGSRDVEEHGFNRAIEARRQVGSLLKPYVYLLALANPGRWSLASWIDDTPVTVQLSRGQQWKPKNSDGKSHGTVRLIDALAHSYNQATVRLGMEVEPERLAKLVTLLAGMNVDKNPALILGATDQSPYAMTQLYQFLAAGGEIQPLMAVRGVLDQDGRLLKRYAKDPAPAQEGDRLAANLVTVALQEVVSSGTARGLLSDGLGRLNAAGKTGTSNDGRDSWYAGYTGDHLAVVWMGNDENAPTGLYGSSGAMRVWSGIFRKLPSAPLVVDNPALDWEWIAEAGSDAVEEGCPGARYLPFVQGYAPPLTACQALQMPVASDEDAGGWRSWFGLDRPEEPVSVDDVGVE